MRNAIRSKKSNKTVATVKGTFVVQYGAEEVDAARTAFPRAIDGSPVLRRSGTVTERPTPNGAVELACDVEYGPVLGAYESDLRRQLERVKEETRTIHGEVFNCRRSEISKGDLDLLRARVDDLSLSLPTRKYLADLLAKVHDVNDERPPVTVTFPEKEIER